MNESPSRSPHRFVPLATALLVVAILLLPLGGSVGLIDRAGPRAPRPEVGVIAASTTSATTYSERFLAPYLASSQTFTFTLDQIPYSGPGGGSVVATGLSAGPHGLSNVTEGPVAAGWAAYGRSDVGNPTLVPENPVVNLTFAVVNLTAPFGIVHFHEDHVPAGTIWQLAFNGTVYSSLTQWINISSHPGTFPYAPKTVTSLRGTTIYRAPSFQPAFAALPGSTYEVAFTVVYAVQVIASSGGSVTPAGTTWWAPGSNVTIRATGTNASAFGTWTGVGSGSYSGPEPRRALIIGGPVIETASFWPISSDRFNIRFQTQGLPNGTEWTVYVNGRGFGTATPVLVVPNLFSCALGSSAGGYNISVPAAFSNNSAPGFGVQYLPGPYPAVACGGAYIFLNYSTQYLVDVGSGSGGSATLEEYGLPIPTGSWVAAADPLTLSASPLAGYEFAGWNGTGAGSYTGPAAIVNLTANGSIREVASFAPLPGTVSLVYSLTLAAQRGLAPGTVWSATVDGVTHSSSGPTLVVPALAAGAYTVTVAVSQSSDGSTEFEPSPSEFTANVPGGEPSEVNFTPEYWVSVASSTDGATVSPSGWSFANASLTLSELPAAGTQFQGWVGTGPGAYSGPLSRPNLTIVGPVTEVAVFGPAPPGGAVAAPSDLVLVLVAAAGLTTGGIAAGLIVVRRRRSARAADDSEPAREEPRGGAP